MSAIEHKLEWNLRRLEMLRRIEGNRIVAQANLERGRLPILTHLLGHPNSSQREIAQVLHISPASVAVTARRMEKDGLLTRKVDEGDQRVNRLAITPLGREKAEQCFARFEETNARMFHGFSPGELEDMMDYVVRMFDNLSGDEYTDFPFFAISPNEASKPQEDEDD